MNNSLAGMKKNILFSVFSLILILFSCSRSNKESKDLRCNVYLDSITIGEYFFIQNNNSITLEKKTTQIEEYYQLVSNGSKDINFYFTYDKEIKEDIGKRFSIAYKIVKEKESEIYEYIGEGKYITSILNLEKKFDLIINGKDFSIEKYESSTIVNVKSKSYHYFNQDLGLLAIEDNSVYLIEHNSKVNDSIYNEMKAQLIEIIKAEYYGGR